MAANLTTQPPGRAYAGDAIWTKVETDLITGAAGYFRIVISSPGPGSGNTLTLTWPGGTITYEVGSTDGSLNWPEQGGATLTDYTNTVAAFLRYREDVAALFRVHIQDAAGGEIRLIRRVVEAYDLTVSANTLSNVVVTAVDGTAASAEENLRAYVEVWTDDGDFNTDRRLLAIHSPYSVDTSDTDIDISGAFAHLAPALPDPAGINPAAPPSSLPFALATGAYQKYILRVADKYGSPAVAEALYPWGPYTALYGSRSTEAFSSGTIRLCHNYRRRDGFDFRKPTGAWQPDWVYYTPAGGQTVYVTLTVYWSDGTTSVYNPWGTDTETISDGKLYWFVSGFRQLLLHDLAPSGSTAADAYIVGYDWKLKGAALSPLATVRYDLVYDSGWEHYLLFDNGLGGMETVFLRGKAIEAYQVTGEEYQRPRRPGHTVQQGDFDVLAAAGRPSWSMSTGWYSDPFYLEHLRQLPLAKAWLIDRVQRRFLKAIVEPKAIDELRKDDEVLFSLQFTIKAGWTDTAANI